METQTTQPPNADLVRGLAYVGLILTIVSCVVYAFVIDARGKNIGAFAIAFMAFVGLILLISRGRSAKRGADPDEIHRPNVNPATGLPMNGIVDSAGNFRGSGRRYN